MTIENDFFADLHVHTNYSDGFFSPEIIVQKAIEIGLGAIAVTDHDGVEGIQSAVDAARDVPLEVIPGVEISAFDRDKEIHLLGYFVDYQDSSFTRILEKMRRNRVERMKKILGLLSFKGIKIEEHEMFGMGKDRAVGRLHLARVMARDKIVRNTKEAFDKYIGDKGSCYVRHKRLDYREAIAMIKSSGGVAVLAHPVVTDVDERIPEYVKNGLRGIEVYHSKQNTSDNQKYLKIADEYGLLITGGSDCHGNVYGKMLLGTAGVNKRSVDEIRESAKEGKNDQE